jgi:hypothetical protein
MIMNLHSREVKAILKIRINNYFTITNWTFRKYIVPTFDWRFKYNMAKVNNIVSKINTLLYTVSKLNLAINHKHLFNTLSFNNIINIMRERDFFPFKSFKSKEKLNTRKYIMSGMFLDS